MSPRVKRAAIVIVKIAVLAAILDYARRQSQSTDEIALPAEASAGAAVLAERGAAVGVGPHRAFVLPGAEGRAVRVAPGARLPVVEKVRAVGGTGAVFRARTPDGALVDIAETDVQGAAGAADTAPFTLLPSWRTMFASLDVQSSFGRCSPSALRSF